MKKSMIALSLGSHLLLTGGVFAEAPDNGFSTQLESISTSDDFKRRTLDIEYSNTLDNGFTVGVEAAHHQLDEDANRYKANEIKLKGNAQISDSLFFEASIGSGKVDQKNTSNDQQLTTYKARVEGKLGEQLTVGLEHEKDLTFRDQLLTSADGSILSGKTTRADVKYRPAQQVRIEADASKQQLSDGNRSRQGKIGAYYGISPEWPYVWTGVEISHLDYEQQNDGYWTPDNYRAVTASFTGSFPVTDTLDVNSSVSIGRGKEAAASKAGTSYYASVGANKKMTDNAKLSAEAHYIKSQQSNSGWDETGGTLGLTFEHY